jgi:hypothetical protein
MQYARFFLGELLPPSLSRVIYLDCDMAVATSLSELWRTPLGGKVVGAVQDTLFRTIEYIWPHELIRALGRRPDTPFFNSGVLLIDLERWRSTGAGRRALDFHERFGQLLPYWDQCALNLALDGAWVRLPAHWNGFVNYPLPATPASMSPTAPSGALRVYHFAGIHKPWDLRAFDGASRAFFAAYGNANFDKERFRLAPKLALRSLSVSMWRAYTLASHAGRGKVLRLIVDAAVAWRKRLRRSPSAASQDLPPSPALGELLPRRALSSAFRFVRVSGAAERDPCQPLAVVHGWTCILASTAANADGALRRAYGDRPNVHVEAAGKPLAALVRRLPSPEVDLVQIDAADALTQLQTLDLGAALPRLVRIASRHLTPAAVEACVAHLAALGYRYTQDGDYIVAGLPQRQGGRAAVAAAG